MKVSAFTFIRNGTLLGYPYVESIKSVLPIVDEFVVNVGDSDDDTLERVIAIGDPKIKIVESTWNENMQDRGYVYGQQKMIAHFNCTGDWAFYLEGDEIVHEDELQKIRDSMEKWLDDPEVEALAFDYYHFLGAADSLGTSPHYYRSEVRIIRNTIRSYHPDGLFFVVLEKNKKGRYPKAAHTDAHIYHYGNARSPEKMREKTKRTMKYWNVGSGNFNVSRYGWSGNAYKVDPYIIKKFSGSHPKVVQQWVEEQCEPHLKPDSSYQLTSKDKRYRLEMKLENIFNVDFSNKHYKKIR